MSRSLPEWIGRSDDDPIPPRVRLRVLEKFGRRCDPVGGCGRRICAQGRRHILTDEFSELRSDYRRFRRRIMREPICEPGPGQYVDDCHYSKTGWAIWNKDGGCTCKPAKRPDRKEETP